MDEVARLHDEAAALRERIQSQDSLLLSISLLCEKWGWDSKNHLPRAEVIELLADWRSRVTW